jgi:hypothetical protein
VFFHRSNDYERRTALEGAGHGVVRALQIEERHRAMLVLATHHPVGGKAEPIAEEVNGALQIIYAERE